MVESLPHKLPRATDFEKFESDPFAFLQQSRERHGDILVLRDGERIFSRASECPGTIAVFGAELQRVVLSDMETYGMPQPATRKFGLPDNLINLNRSLHSMEGDKHAAQKRILNRVSGEVTLKACEEQILGALNDCTAEWTPRIQLLGQMRNLMFQTGCRVLFGSQFSQREELGSLLRGYFQLRREVSGAALRGETTMLKELAEVGHCLDAELRSFVRDCRTHAAGSSFGLLGKIATLETAPREFITEDEAVGHSNIFFASIFEPMAASMTWILLILSQLPGLRAELRREIRASCGQDESPAAHFRCESKLLRQVIDESLRLLPPNAFMVRQVKQPTLLGGFDIPAGTEIVLCPLLAHRDPASFDQPHLFSPSRWLVESPSAFEYFPFGAGGHACIGRHIAIRLLTGVLGYLLPRFDLTLSKNQEIDWRLHIIFLPREDIHFSISRLIAGETPSSSGGKLLGPVGKLLTFTPDSQSET